MNSCPLEGGVGPASGFAVEGDMRTALLCGPASIRNAVRLTALRILGASITPRPDSGAAVGQPLSPSLRFTDGESRRAHEKWKASCGPHSIAAACGRTLDDVRLAIPPPYRGWMSPAMVGDTLRTLGWAYTLRKGLKTHELCEGLNRVQWEGKWLDPGVHASVAYFHTHWIAKRGGMVLCTAIARARWIPEEWFGATHRANGNPFHITHHYVLASKIATQRYLDFV